MGFYNLDTDEIRELPTLPHALSKLKGDPSECAQE